MQAEDLFEQTENELNKGALWGIVYGDFMSYMMVFFLVLFAFSLDAKQGKEAKVEESLDSLQRQFGGSISAERLRRLSRSREEEALSKDLEELVRSQGLEGLASVVLDAKRIRLVLTAPVLFDSGKAELKAAAVQILRGVAGTLRKTRGEVIVEGHTDNVPIHSRQFASNWDLSVARANVVVKLLSESGVEPQRLSASGYGEYRPRGPNDRPERQALNRRIEVSLARSSGEGR